MVLKYNNDSFQYPTLAADGRAESAVLHWQQGRPRADKSARSNPAWSEFSAAPCIAEHPTAAPPTTASTPIDDKQSEPGGQSVASRASVCLHGIAFVVHPQRTLSPSYPVTAMEKHSDTCLSVFPTVCGIMAATALRLGVTIVVAAIQPQCHGMRVCEPNPHTHLW